MCSQFNLKPKWILNVFEKIAFIVFSEWYDCAMRCVCFCYVLRFKAKAATTKTL